MPNIAHPTSIVLIPVPDARMGPMVDPQGESFLTITSCKGTLACLANILNSDVDTKSDAYLWLWFSLITTPLFI